MLRKIINLFQKPRRFHDRADGPVVINPDVAEIIHIHGRKR